MEEGRSTYYSTNTCLLTLCQVLNRHFLKCTTSHNTPISLCATGKANIPQLNQRKLPTMHEMEKPSLVWVLLTVRGAQQVSHGHTVLLNLQKSDLSLYSDYHHFPLQLPLCHTSPGVGWHCSFHGPCGAPTKGEVGVGWV